MIEQTEVQGRPAIIAYLRPDMTPGTPEDHAWLKVMYKDERGGVAFLRREDDRLPNQDN